MVWVSLGKPAHDVPPFPEWDRPEYRKLLCGPYPVNASGPRIVENFDVGHFPFVHENILGTRERLEIEEYEAEIGPDGVVAPSVRVYQPDPYGTGRRRHRLVHLPRAPSAHRVPGEGIEWTALLDPADDPAP